MPSHLTQLCDRIGVTSQQITRTAAVLAEQADRLARAAHDLATIARDEPRLANAVQQLAAAASACRRASWSLEQAAQQGHAFVARTVAGLSEGGMWTGPLVHSTETGAADSVDEADAVAALELRTPAGSAYFAADDSRMRAAAGDVPPYPDEYVIDMHGDRYSVACGEYRLDATGLAALIRASAWDGHTPIRLFSCKTGGDPEGIAQQLADRLGVVVTAPDRPVSTGPLGVQVGDVAEVWNPMLGGYVGQVISPGEWHRFTPRKGG